MRVWEGHMRVWEGHMRVWEGHMRAWEGSPCLFATLFEHLSLSLLPLILSFPTLLPPSLPTPLPPTYPPFKVANHCPGLREIYLYETGVTSFVLGYLAAKCPSLTLMSIDEGVYSDGMRDTMEAHFPHLTVFD